jgi:hypothetical protein
MKKALLLFIPVVLLASIFAVGLNETPAEAVDYSGHTAVLHYAEIITDPGSGIAGGTQYLRQDLGNGQLTSDFVYADPRRALFNGGQVGVTYGIKPSNASQDTNLTAQNYWLEESVLIWDSLRCADLTLTKNTISGGPGIVQIFFQTGQIPLIHEADLTQIGFLSAAEFPYFAANPSVLGVTFTLSWVDAEGNLTDIDHNGKSDVAFREIYYNDEYEWSDNGVGGERGSGIIDFPTVAIHEVGHGVSLAHFGSIGLDGDGALVAKPRSIMNAIYGGTLRELAGRDISSTCSNWANWPNR